MELNNVSHWLNLNKLSLNVKKTKAMAFHMPQKKIIQPNIQINGSNIEFVENCIIISLYGGSHASDVLHVLMGVSVA